MSGSRDIVAIVPARGGSKRVPGKNLMELAGHPLLGHTLLQATASDSVTEVWVSTEDDQIAAVAASYGAEVVRRPQELATDEADSESAILHALDSRRQLKGSDPELVVFLQCTSPVRRPRDIDSAVELFDVEGADSLFSVCEEKAHLWQVRDGQPGSLTFDYRARQREQDMSPVFRENGSIYVFKPEMIRTGHNRLGGRMVMYPMDYWSSFQIDSPEDAQLLEWILTTRNSGGS